MHTVLTIASSDSSGGAGLQADIKTMTAHGVFATCAIASVTAQNTTCVAEIFPMPPNLLYEQIALVVNDIRPEAVKIGLLPSTDLVEATAKALRDFNLRPVVLDPVLIATSGARLTEDNTIEAFKEKLIPLATLLTPNLPELQTLTGKEIASCSDMESAGLALYKKYNCAVLAKGGHSAAWDNQARDVLCNSEGVKWFTSERVANNNTHGTGCTLSSAIACELALGATLPCAIQKAKAYLTGALKAKLDLGKGSNPLNHSYDLHSTFIQNC